jgi:opacity protein-like surface antigen
MFRQKMMIIVVGGVAALALPAFAQSEENVSKQDISVQAFGSFLKTNTQNGVENKSDDSAGVLGTYRYFFSDHQGVEADYGFTQNYQYYGQPGSFAGVKIYSNEISGAYLFRMPTGKRITPFALAGAGALVFDPHNFAGADTQTRAAGIYGAGADINLSSHVFLRAEYRGLIYNSPTYGLAAFSGFDRVTHRAEPSVGFGYRF